MQLAAVARTFSRTSIGLKAAMAASGLGLVLFVTLHALGNLLVFLGPIVIDGYADLLHDSVILWLVRIAVVVGFAVHVPSAIILTRRARASREEGYRRALAPRASTAASRTMRWGGLALLLYTAYHLLHIYGPLHPSYVHGGVHHNLVAGLAHPAHAALYAAASIALGLHLHHGTVSALRTLGWGGSFRQTLRRVGTGWAIALTIAFLAPCVAAVSGWL